MDINEYNLKIAALEFEQSNAMLNWMGNLARTLFSTLVMINGGAIISLLTFVGNSKHINKLYNLWPWSFVFFGCGILCVVIAICFAFCAQKIFREGLDKDIKEAKETDYSIKNKKGIFMRNLSIFSTILSVLCFIVGAILAIIALKNSI